MQAGMTPKFGKLELVGNVEGRRAELEKTARYLQEPIAVLENHGVDLFVRPSQDSIRDFEIGVKLEGQEPKALATINRYTSLAEQIVGRAIALGMQYLGQNRTSQAGPRH